MRLIDADALIETLKTRVPRQSILWQTYNQCDVLGAIADSPTIEQQKPEPAKKESMQYTHWFVCGACAARLQPGDNYCRHCGRPILWST